MTGFKLLAILSLFLLAGYVEVKAETVPVIKEWKKGKYCHLESTFANLLGMKTMAETVITYEELDE